MYPLTRAWPSGFSLALLSLSVLGCSDESGDIRRAQQQKLALELSDAASSEVDPALAEDAVDAAVTADAPETCAANDSTCNGIDDDCDGENDEDFPSRCVFGSVAVICVNGAVRADSCNDGNPCTTDACDPQGCHHAAVSCDDGNPCTADQCDASGACSSVPSPGHACDDGNSCTTDDACTDSGNCGGGTSVPVDDDNPCTIDACDSSAGITHVPALGQSCDDGNLCSQSDTCNDSGGCSGLPLAEFDDHDPCTADSCDPATGSVSHTIASIGASCSDGDACNGEETCRQFPEIAVTVRSLESFYRVDNSDVAEDAHSLRLADYGLSVGQRIRLRTEGQFDLPAVRRVTAVFSSSDTLLPHTELKRVPGAIQTAAPPCPTGETFFEHQATEIPEDFRVDEMSIEIEIPPGAQYLFVSNPDSFYADNAGMLQVMIQTELLDCVADAPAPGVCEGPDAGPVD
jgi:hypothetical protein